MEFLSSLLRKNIPSRFQIEIIFYQILYLLLKFSELLKNVKLNVSFYTDKTFMK